MAYESLLAQLEKDRLAHRYNEVAWQTEHLLALVEADDSPAAWLLRSKVYYECAMAHWQQGEERPKRTNKRIKKALKFAERSRKAAEKAGDLLGVAFADLIDASYLMRKGKNGKALKALLGIVYSIEKYVGDDKTDHAEKARGEHIRMNVYLRLLNISVEKESSLGATSTWLNCLLSNTAYQGSGKDDPGIKASIERAQKYLTKEKKKK